VRKLALSTAAAGIGLALLIAAGASARAEANTIKVSATMRAAQETPTPTGDVSGARGTFTATLTKSGTGATVAWKLTFSGLTGPASAAHIHIGARGQAGPVSLPLCGPCTSGMTGTGTATAELVNALQAGRAYANVHTGQNPAGEIRGQVDIVSTFRAKLVPGQERPAPKGNLSNAKGLFKGTVTKSGSTAFLKWRLTFSGLTGPALAAHIHIGARGTAGAVAVPLCGPCKSGVSKRVKLSSKVLFALQTGRAYVNVHTARNPGGEIRAQLPALALSLTSTASDGGGGGGGDDCLYPPCP
jgi:hypothetical protein